MKFNIFPEIFEAFPGFHLGVVVCRGIENRGDSPEIGGLIRRRQGKIRDQFTLEGLPELVEQIFNLPVRRGYPAGVGGLVDVVNNPIYATGVGLVLYGNRQGSVPGRSHRGDRSFLIRMGQRMRRWFAESF